MKNIIKNRILSYLSSEKRIFVTSSFQTHSIPMLHIISSIDKSIPIYFMDTGFHFPETIQYKDHITQKLDLNVIDLSSSTPKFNQRDSSGRFYFCSDPDFCCHINKIKPLEPILMSNDIWISGVRADQNANRSNMLCEMDGPFNTTRYHPMLNWNSKMIWSYRKEYDLPPHPLERKGYLSVGCEPCTQKYVDNSREGRWKGLNKNECGLHTELVNK